MNKAIHAQTAAVSRRALHRGVRKGDLDARADPIGKRKIKRTGVTCEAHRRFIIEQEWGG